MRRIIPSLVLSAVLLVAPAACRPNAARPPARVPVPMTVDPDRTMRPVPPPQCAYPRHTPVTGAACPR